LDELERQSNVVDHPPCDQSDQQNELANTTNDDRRETCTQQRGTVGFC